MIYLRKKILYAKDIETESLTPVLFWLSAGLCALFLILYIYSVYLTIGLSYKIERELLLAKEETALYQQLEERYVEKLENLREDGARALGLGSPENQSFLSKRDAVAKADLPR